MVDKKPYLLVNYFSSYIGIKPNFVLVISGRPIAQELVTFLSSKIQIFSKNIS